MSGGKSFSSAANRFPTESLLPLVLTLVSFLPPLLVEQNVFSELFGEGDFMRPDEVTYAVLIKGYGQDLAHPNWTKIRQMLQTMETSGIDLTICTYNALLEICANSNDWQRGMQVLDQVYDKSVSPDQNTLEIVKKRKTLRAHFKKLFS